MIKQKLQMLPKNLMVLYQKRVRNLNVTVASAECVTLTTAVISVSRLLANAFHQLQYF